MRLIDADALPLERYGEEVISWYATGWNDAIDAINRAPAVDAEPVRHGKWIVQKVDANQTKFYCSECERCVLCGNDYFMKPTKHIAYFYPYCHCGAKMDKGVQNDQN